MPAPRKRWLIAGVAAVVVVAVAAFLVFALRPAPMPPIAGMVRQTEIRIAPEMTGRLVSIPVHAGQPVGKGELLALLTNPELQASLGEAQAALKSAIADRANVYAGVRAEEVAILRRSVETAEANLRFAEQEDVRAVALEARQFASRQQLDESNAALTKARADLMLKRAQLAAAEAGPTKEERALADMRVALAEATVADLQAKVDKLRLVAPADGTVGILVAELGEVLPVGKPVLTLDVAHETWFAFTLREDALNGLAVGSEVTLSTDDGKRIAARVTELRSLGEFATWRAARAVGDHDLNSFRLRLDPVDPATELPPGMTVWLQR
ncbi:MAG: HlyD family efflux transporter periplasmic adaptor subunit [Alphaproteobacteria bacterium]|nr:HlyD family efflux transporter periplasmic adaptor subunit [Alphaproteobacteria bacterium]MBV8409890.1 HlyD family efflux transporter periplasmic adaptor subunit [Alphaproteobacteria bacterium]